MKATLLTAVLMIVTAFLFTVPLAEAQGDPRDLPSGAESTLQHTPQYQWTDLHWAVRRGNEDAVSALAARGMLEARDAMGRTPLHIAVLSGHDDIVRVLIESGADVNAPDQWAVTPLRRAQIVQETRGWDRTAIAQRLRDAGAEKADMAGVRE